VGEFLHTHKPPPLHMRLVARRARRWDATWYCVDCHRENDESEEEVEKRLGMTKRMSANMSYLYGGEPCDQRHYRSMLHARERPRSHQCGHRPRDWAGERGDTLTAAATAIVTAGIPSPALGGSHTPDPGPPSSASGQVLAGVGHFWTVD